MVRNGHSLTPVRQIEREVDMILKIHFEDDWWIYDNIDRVRFSYEEYEAVSEDFGDHYRDLTLVDSLRSNSRTPADGDTVKFVRISWRDRSDKEMVALFDEVAYLCNDEGKTIEKIPGPKHR